MKFIYKYIIHILMVVFALGFATTYTMYIGRQIEIEQLRNNDTLFREYIKELNERIIVLESYPYDHSEIKTNNNDRVTNLPEHNDTRNCFEYR